MKILLFFTYIFTAISLNAQVVDVISGQFSGAQDADIEGDNIYIADFLNGSVVKVDLLSPTNPPQVVGNVPDIISILINGSDAYFIDLFGTILRRDASDFTSNEVVLASGLTGSPVNLAFKDDFLYFSELNGNAIKRIDLLNGNVITTVVSNVNGPQGITFIGNDLYVAISGDNTIGKIDVAASNPQISTVATVTDNPSSLTSQGSTLYIGEFSLSSARIYSLNVAMSNPTPILLADNLSNIAGLNYYGSNSLYFVQGGSGNLSRLDVNPVSVSNTLSKDDKIKVFPNPSNGELTIEAQNTVIEWYSISYLSGRLVSKTIVDEFSANQTRCQLNAEKGIFILTIATSEGMVRKKVIIQ